MHIRQFKLGIITVIIPMILLCSHQTFAGRTLSKDIAPDVPAKTLRLIEQQSAIYYDGSGKKDVVFIADPFCVNSRKTYRVIKKNIQYIQTIKMLWVSRYSQLGSDIIAAHVIRSHSLGTGNSAMEAAFNLEIPQESGFKARRRTIDLVKNSFQIQLGENEKADTLPELHTVVKNTKLAEDLGYEGTPHLIVGNRVLNGYSRAAIKILLREQQ